MENRFESFTISILKLNKLVHKIKLYEMKDYGLKAVHVMCVYYLGVNKNGLTAGELSKLTLEDKAAISRALSLLKEKGYVVYDNGKYNGCIRLTEEGVKLADIIDEKSGRAVEAAGGTLTEEEREIFYNTVNIVAEKLNDYYNSLIAGEDGNEDNQENK